jgi:hypothetical protein
MPLWLNSRWLIGAICMYDGSPAFTLAFNLFICRDRRDAILSLVEQAASSATGGPPSHHLQAALIWVDLAIQWSATSLRACRVSLELLSTLLVTGYPLESPALRLSNKAIHRAKSLAADSAACALTSGQVVLAVELLEHGREAFFAQTRLFRTRIDELEAIDTGLALRFRKIHARREGFVRELGRETVESSSTWRAEHAISMCVCMKLTMSFCLLLHDLQI